MVDRKKIRVLQLVFSFGHGGAEKLAVDIACTLDRTRFDPYLLGIYGGGPAEVRLKSNGVPYANFARMGRTALELQLQNFIKKQRIDIVHVHGSFILTRAVIPSRLVGAKLVYTEHATYSLEKKWRLRYLTRVAAHYCHAVTGVSNLVKEFLVKSVCIAEDRITVIYNGVDLHDFKKFPGRTDVPGLPPCSEENLLVGVVARLSEAKDHTTLLEAWRLVKERGSWAKLVIVGDGELRADLVEKTRVLGLSESVIFLGDRSDVPAILSRLDLCVLPSKREGLPIALLEAMACGKPIVATRVGGIPEVIHDEKNGFLVPPKNPEVLADRIARLSQDRELRENMANQARKTVEETFSLNRMVESYQDLFLSIMRGKV